MDYIIDAIPYQDRKRLRVSADGRDCMSLPKIILPIVNVSVPSTKKELKIRPMRVAEEKILLRAKEGTSGNEMLLAIKQVVNNCIADTDVDTGKLTLFDIEYLFLKIRSVSVGNEVEITYTDVEDNNEEHTFKINLDEVEVRYPDKQELDIKVGPDTGLRMKYPEAVLYESKIFADEEATEQQLFDELVVNCVDKYFHEDKTYNLKDSSPLEIREFINSLDIKTYGKIKDFIREMPTVYKKIDYKDSQGKDKNLELSSLTDFFSLV